MGVLDIADLEEQEGLLAGVFLLLLLLLSLLSSSCFSVILISLSKEEL